METKNFQIIMDVGAHAVTKSRAKTMDLKIGEFIENMLASLEFRLSAAYEKAGIKKEDTCEKSDKMGITAILKSDNEQWTEKRLGDEFRNIRASLTEDRTSSLLWTPKIKISGEKQDT